MNDWHQKTRWWIRRALLWRARAHINPTKETRRREMWKRKERKAR